MGCHIDPAQASVTIERIVIGETLGNYRVVSSLGKGGMGEVYLAEHQLIGRTAAIKVLLPQMSIDADLVHRFFNEAKLAGRLQHPGLVEVFDFGIHHDGSAYIVMELLHGESLTKRIASSGRLPLGLALAVTRQVAIALHAAHEHGVVHRDLKPENVFLTKDAESPAGIRVKVLDFGIAKLAQEDAPRSVKTKTGAVFGTPRYMAPEQCRNAGGVDRRADIYALGCIVYEMVLGVPPFDYDGWGELVAAHIHETPPRPTELSPGLSPSVESLVLRMLAKRVEDRFQTMAEVVAALDVLWDELAANGEVSLTRPPSAPLLTRAASIDGPASAPTLPVAAEMKPSMPPPRRRRYVVPLVAGTVVAAGAIVVLVTGAGARDRDDRPTRAAAPIANPAPAPAQVAPVEPPPAPAPAPESETIQLVVESVPSGADVYRRSDGVRLGRTPWSRTFVRTDGALDLRIKLSGYRDEQVTLSTERDGKQVVKLVASRSRPSRGDKPRGQGSGGPTFLDPYGEK